jgi:hypothetical protein
MLLKHVLLPGCAILMVVGLYFAPVSVVGCANRGLAAILVVTLSLVLGVGAATKALRLRSNCGKDSNWWALSALILAIPALLVFGPLA